MEYTREVLFAVAQLKAGHPVAFPTETVYGLGAPLSAPDTIAKIFALKGRPHDNPLIVHISSLDQLAQIVTSYPASLVHTFWPGPLTLILPKKEEVSPLISAGLPTIGVRMPSHPLALQLLEALGEPLVAPSANRSGSPSSTCAAHVRDDFGEELFILDGGESLYGMESTVLALDPPLILRPGALSRQELERVLGLPLPSLPDHAVDRRSPGTQYRHYAPRALVCLVEREPTALSPKQLLLRGLTQERLYAALREADRDGYEEVVVLCDAALQEDEVLMNRLRRAARR